ncbi:MAG: protein translocase subunit SecD, partial [Proteobacteria bacterium]|nr:protein translocase subunit SecD [Pseudomonadota bacterium]
MMQMSLMMRITIVFVLVASCLLALPNVLTSSQREALPGWLPKQAMNLGLDLQGGAHLVLQVQMDDVMVRAYENLEDQVRMLAREKRWVLGSVASGKDGVVLGSTDAALADALRTELGREQVEVAVAGQGMQLVFNSTMVAELKRRALGQTLQVLRSRVDEFGVAEPLIQQQGDDRVIVELPGVSDVARAKASIGKTAQLTFHLVKEEGDMALPLGGLMTLQEPRDGVMVPLVVHKRPSLTGEMLTSAAAGFDQYGAPAVDIAFDARGTKLFAQLSTNHVNKRFAIVLDGKVYSAPVFREPILGGRAQISGSFKTEEAQDLAAILNAGALPAAVNVVEERTVGPSLGADSVQAGLAAMVGGLIAVLVFMFLFYGLFGMAANIGLVANLVILVAVMSALGFTLTLPGMAGMVLTLGMAVDANVLIFERMREEVLNGKKPFAALLAGF